MAEAFAANSAISRARSRSVALPKPPQLSRKLFSSTRRDGKVARYKRRELLGKGSFAEVWKADDRKTRTVVALKIMNAGDAAQSEYQITQGLNHVNVVRVLSCIRSPSQFIIVQEFAAGGELFDKIVPDVGLDEYQARLTLSDMLDAMDYLDSQGIVHTDIKPENIVLGQDGRSKLCDFGLAEYAGQLIHRRHGTEPYMPPEVLRNPSHAVFVHSSWDMWSLGVVLFVMLAGDFPWERAVSTDTEFSGHLKQQHVHQAWKRFSRTLTEMLDFMLQVEPSHRPSTHQVRSILTTSWKKSSCSRSNSLNRGAGPSDSFDMEELRQGLDNTSLSSAGTSRCSHATSATGLSLTSEFGFDDFDGFE